MKSKTKRSSKGKVSVPLYRWMMFWLLVLCNVALVAALFGRVDVRTLLAKPQIKVIERVVEVEKEKNSADSRTSTFDERYTYDEFMRYNYIDYECRHTERDPGPPETYFTYIEKETLVSMVLPYSFSWGTSNCPPLRTDSVGIWFGPVTPSADNPMRDVSLIISEATSTQSLREYLTDNSSLIRDVRERVVSGMTVISYREEYIGGRAHWEAFGRNYNYSISSRSWLTDAEAIKIIQSLRVTR